MALNIGKGWYGESQRHSNARKYGRAGGLYKNEYNTKLKLRNNPVQRNTLTAQQIFKKRFPKGQKNFITPNVERYGKLNKTTAYELSSGSGIFKPEERIYGVTITELKDGDAIGTKQSRSFTSRENAERYIDNLSRVYKVGVKTPDLDKFERAKLNQETRNKTVFWFTDKGRMRSGVVNKELKAQTSVQELEIIKGDTLLEVVGREGENLVPKNKVLIKNNSNTKAEKYERCVKKVKKQKDVESPHAVCRASVYGKSKFDVARKERRKGIVK